MASISSGSRRARWRRVSRCLLIDSTWRPLQGNHLGRCAVGVFVGADADAARSSVEIPFGFAAVRAELLRSRDTWLRRLLEEARAETRLLQAEVGLGLSHLPGPLRVEAGDPSLGSQTVEIPFRVGVDGVSERWPRFDSVLTAAWFGERRTQLVLTGRYQSPEHLDEGRRALLHRLVDAVGGYFVTWVAEELGERLGGAAAISSPPRRRRARRIA